MVSNGLKTVCLQEEEERRNKRGFYLIKRF